MRAHRKQSFAVAAVAAGVAFCASRSALASSPLEYPDNGSAQFSRAGAWLATANEPIATHYNPAALATQGSGFSIEQQLNFEHTCYDRHGPNGAPQTVSPTVPVQYEPICNDRGSFPTTIPSISLAWRVSKKLGVGISIVPPAAYGNSDQQFPVFKYALNTATGQQQLAPAPYRYQQLNQLSTILFPTIGFGYEILPKLRVGAAFISGITIINFNIAGIESQINTAKGDDITKDTLSYLHTKDLFVPGGILSLHWSPLTQLDVAAWGRVLADAYSTSGDLTVLAEPYAGTSTIKPLCQQPDKATCTSAPTPVTTVNQYGNDAFRHLRFPYPPEVRLGVRFHQPRSQKEEPKYVQRVEPTDKPPVRDPLHDDVFDIELDGSYSFNASANTVEARFAEGPGSGFPNGAGVITVSPVGYIPPNADKWNGYQNSYGLRLGGQLNVIPDKLGIRAGTWYESQSVDPKWLSIAIVGGQRGGFGGGLVFRQDFIDISIGYQYHWSSGLDNGGQGAMRAVVGQLSTGGTQNQPFNTNLDPAGATAATRTQFRSAQTVNDGRMTQSAHAFTLGGTVRF
jgi:long-chain fatty acid transport protein